MKLDCPVSDHLQVHNTKILRNNDLAITGPRWEDSFIFFKKKRKLKKKQVHDWNIF